MLITLTTDFGDSGGFVAQLKAKILELFGNGIRIIDITHNISPFNSVKAAYIARTVVPKFEQNSVHIVVVDPGVGSDRNIVAVKFDGKYIISPDNEALSMIAPSLVVNIDKNSINPSSSKTFEAYDIMIPAAYMLYKNGIESLGKKDRLNAPKLFPVKRKQIIKGNIVYIDRFGNCISNIDKHILSSGFKKIALKEIVFSKLSSTYQDSSKLYKALINSSGFLEFSIYKKSFAKRFNVQYLDEVEISL